ncbi:MULTISPECIES: DUF4136 domain-containing protein [Ramlibacter]|uniref:DUF4136 domain-containing protein n=1 Tax=Ramlibacter aquaticus TaxID=2780094 RepID=A0ABR9SB92_9BURK|nr:MULTISPECIES: DUF4136 domain-containing protein [Ramlibacter]MBE7939124.1 DUF4136 domain-containing protein [Ramlibacter aquaticus]
MKASRSSLVALLAMLALLAGCAGVTTIDSQVRAFSAGTALPAPTSYRFERLPSQQDVNQPRLEAMADTALAQVGLRRDDAAPRLSVQIGARVQQVLSPWDDPWMGWGLGWHRHHGGMFMGSQWTNPWYQREVSVIVRDLSSNKVIFESHATSDGPWGDNAMVLPAMFQAAMAGFPNPPAGPRTVNITVPG